jgi:hypothetical protein
MKTKQALKELAVQNGGKFKLMSEKKYVKKGGCICPGCGSDAIESRDSNADGDTVLVDTACGDCGLAWTDVYKLSGYVVRT